MTKAFGKYKDITYFVFRVLVGLAFLLHGGQKLFGWFGGLAGDGIKVELFGLMGFAGIIEFFGGLAILLGIFVTWVALIAAIEMLIAYFTMHLPNGVLPLGNGGEPAWLFFAAFLVLLTHGAGKWAFSKK